jgi:hypothetical protein
LNVRAKTALLALCSVGVHGVVRRLPHLIVHLTLPPVTKTHVAG